MQPELVKELTDHLNQKISSRRLSKRISMKPKVSVKLNQKTSPGVIDVARQSHYLQFKIQPMEYIQVNKIGWCAGNIIKYVSRYEMKNGLEDLHKAKMYLLSLIEYEENKSFKTPDMLPTMASKASKRPNRALKPKKQG